jgi:glutamine transport system permease protein
VSNWNVIEQALPALTTGAILTLKISVVSLLFAFFIGLFAGLMRISRNRFFRLIATVYIDLIRGTPLLIQVLFIYFGLPSVLGIKLSALTAGILAISINAGAYLVEIFRAGIESIPKGQMEAGRSLGFNHGQTMRFIILPQAIRRMVPALVNQFIISLKDTSLLSVIGVAELTLQGQTIYSMNFKAFQILSTVAVFYLIIIYILTLIMRVVERRFVLT